MAVVSAQTTFLRIAISSSDISQNSLAKVVQKSDYTQIVAPLVPNRSAIHESELRVVVKIPQRTRDGTYMLRINTQE